MKMYSVHEISNLLHISKDTLRYYDKLGLVSPSRGENRYRYYSEQDILDLKYIEVFKNAEFSLEEIRHFFNYMRSLASAEDCDNIEHLLTTKKEIYLQKIKAYESMLLLADKMLDVKKQIASPKDIEKANELVITVFNEIKGEKSEK